MATAMETGLQQVATGTNLVSETRQSLTAIVEATAAISRLTEGITQATQVHQEQSQSVTQIMFNVAAITSTTSNDSTQLSTSFNELLNVSENLQASVERFKVE